MALEVMRIDEEKAHMVEIHRGSNAAVLFEFFPGTLHLFGIVDIIEDQDPFLW